MKPCPNCGSSNNNFGLSPFGMYFTCLDCGYRSRSGHWRQAYDDWEDAPRPEPKPNCPKCSRPWINHETDMQGGAVCPKAVKLDADPAFSYANQLATTIWEKHWKQDALNWSPSDSTLGCLAQIDNMVSGMARVTPHWQHATDSTAENPLAPLPIEWMVKSWEETAPLTKLDEFAKAAMQALIANPERRVLIGQNAIHVSAYDLAECMLAESKRRNAK